MVQTKVDNGIASIEFSHPKSNSLPRETLQKLAETISENGQNESVKVIILKSAGDKAFCAGASFDELLSVKNPETGKEFFMGFARLINAARKCPKFIIGSVQGKAVGGGVGIASAVDYCMATEAASVKLSELSIAIGPFVVGPSVIRKIGVSGFSQLSINATEWKDAQWAKEKGLYMEVFPNIDTLNAAVNELAQKLSLYNPEAMMLMKKTIWEGTDHWDILLEERAEMSGRLVLSNFTKKAIEKFRTG